MVLSNPATLLGISPREIAHWFWVAYTDAYDRDVLRPEDRPRS